MTINDRIITQKNLHVQPWMHPATKRLPGLNPLNMADWLLLDDAFAAQMQYRDELLADQRSKVFAVNNQALEASAELLAQVLKYLPCSAGYEIHHDSVVRPDGVSVSLNDDHPLLIAGRLVQQDFCLLNKVATEHVLQGAVLCFPSSWSLKEKMNQPMIHIHTRVESYGSEMAKRVQRIFDNIRPENPMWRANYLFYEIADLFQPQKLQPTNPTTSNWVRVERQSLVALPETDFVVFGIHTHIVPITCLSPESRAGFIKAWMASHQSLLNASS